MLNRILFASRYFKYLFLKKTKVKSPFVQNLLDEVIKDKRQFYVFEQIEGIRSALKQNQTVINMTDFGAGSNINSSTQRKVSDIAKNSAKAPALGQMMFKLIHKFQPAHLLELGTSLGISACYQIAPNKKANFTTMEGCPQTAKFAQKVIEKISPNFNIVVGDFNKTLPTYLNNTTSLDYVFFDGNHQMEPTIEYFEACLEKAHQNSIFVFDDIHWSSGMENAWEHIKNHPKVTVTLDLFWVGIVFFKPDEQKENYIV